MKKQRLYWLAEMVESNATTWRERHALRHAVERDAREALTETEWAEVLSWLHAGGRVEYKPGKGQKDMIRRTPRP